MSGQPAIAHGYPLSWPDGRPRCADRKSALFREDGRSLTWTAAFRRLREQTAMVTRPGESWRVTDMVLSTNIRFTASGSRDRNISRRDPDDPGAAFYFSFDGQPHVLACDKWDTVQDNVAAIAAHIDALRGQERWGVADLRQAFAGHVALPPPEPWWSILGLEADATLDQAAAAWRRAARSAHPDAGGSRAEWDRVNEAYEQAKRSARNG